MEKKRMINITISLPEIYLDNIEKLQKAGVVASRSDAIRSAIREFLERETDIITLMGFKIDEEKVKESN
jgi:Arc/MetJ-type ribon-helix-helix transcriptional regulator